MKQYVSLDKRSKKAQREYYSKQRLTWGVLNPVTRSVPSGKNYNRKKDKQERRRIGGEFSNGFDADFYAGVGWFCNALHNSGMEDYRKDCKYLNLAANVCGYTPVSLGKIIKDGILSDVPSIHRITIDRAVEKKVQREMIKQNYTTSSMT